VSSPIWATAIGRLWQRRYTIAYLVIVAWVTARVAAFYQPRTGFTSLVLFGERFAERRLARLRDVPIYTAIFDGYDGQFYAQLAVAGDPFDPELGRALDAPLYRSRRILLPLVAHAVGVGRPAWVLNVYALANLICWWLLAWLLARWWFPPRDLDNLLRWAGTLLGAGLMVSLFYALTDGPALLLVAAAARGVERGRPRAAALWLLATGLARETMVLGAAAFVPAGARDRRTWTRAATVAIVCALPPLFWMGWLARHYGYIDDSRNLAPPLASYVRKLREIHTMWRQGGATAAVWNEIAVVAALTVQLAFILGRPAPARPWWRIGAAFAVLGLVLGWPVWESSPSAISRAVLPLTLAFNILAPRVRAGFVLAPRGSASLALLLAGNLTALSAPYLSAPRVMEQDRFVAGVRLDYARGWRGFEEDGRRGWRWAAGREAVLRVHNPTAATLAATLDAELLAEVEKIVHIEGGGLRGDVALPARDGRPVRFGPFPLPPGDTSLDLTAAAAAPPGAFALVDAAIDVHPPPPGDAR
jgi:hypothetical protein